MKKATCAFFLVALLVFTEHARADPILYSFTARIYQSNGLGAGDPATGLDLSGSFVLSDPTITYGYYGLPERNDLIEYSLTDVAFRTSEFTWEGAGQFRMAAPDRTDRYFAFTLGNYSMPLYSSHVWFDLDLCPGAGCDNAYAQPNTIEFGYSQHFLLNGPAGYYRVDNMVANRVASVPEPASLPLIAMGVGTVALARRLRRTRRPLRQV